MDTRAARQTSPVAAPPVDDEGRPVPLHDEAAFEAMARAGELAARTLDFVTPHVQPGVATIELDRLIDGFMRDHGAVPATLGYRGYPASSCISINHVVNHGIPNERRLREGDIANIDVTVILDGWYGDTSRMYLIGDKIPIRARKLVDVTYDAMMAGIAQVAPGRTLGDVGHAIQSLAEAARFSVVRDFVGHGVGRRFHDAPQVHHVGRPGEGLVLQPGMIFTIEPMINAGRHEVKILADGWTTVTRDRSLSAQFEHTVGVTQDGVRILTPSPAGYTRPPYG
ncbi:type I methionyl aminopeptidase [Marinivivus vitaminiproducens]|uniref:type I methionyl aminopeptidase n=1 Tax=Marinivivus vitaminiproducens TaxID=3035935 RepID=UPI00279D2794|nr:type I methionyl aminopeptidase [Geminicoccaceae bacterium SCSIO 64248]